MLAQFEVHRNARLNRAIADLLDDPWPDSTKGKYADPNAQFPDRDGDMLLCVDDLAIKMGFRVGYCVDMEMEMIFLKRFQAIEILI